MPTDIAISVEKISKKFELGSSQAPYVTFRETLQQLPKTLLKKINCPKEDTKNIYYIDSVII